MKQYIIALFVLFASAIVAHYVKDFSWTIGACGGIGYALIFPWSKKY
jgi:hypothetical protein